MQNEASHTPKHTPSKKTGALSILVVLIVLGIVAVIAFALTDPKRFKSTFGHSDNASPASPASLESPESPASPAPETDPKRGPKNGWEASGSSKRACPTKSASIENDVAITECGDGHSDCCYFTDTTKQCPSSMSSTGLRIVGDNYTKHYCSPIASQTCELGSYGCGKELCGRLKKSDKHPDQLVVSADDNVTVSEKDCVSHLGNGDGTPVDINGLKFFSSWTQQCKNAANFLSNHGFKKIECVNSGWKLRSHVD